MHLTYKSPVIDRMIWFEYYCRSDTPVEDGQIVLGPTISVSRTEFPQKYEPNYYLGIL